MATNEFILIGGSEHARVVLDALLSCNEKVHALFDPKFSGELFGIPQLGQYAPEKFRQAKAIIAIGNNLTRKKAVENCKHNFGVVVHASAVVSRFSSIDDGSVVLHGSIVQANARLGKHVIVNTGARIDHDCVIGDYVHIAPSATLCGTVEVGEGSLIGAGSIIIPGIQVGKWATVGAGAVVKEPVPDFAVVVGVPARVVKINKPS